MSLNKVMLIGNVGRDPEIRHLANNSSVARFPLATSEKFKTKTGDLQEQTEWHNIVCWRSLADLAEKYIHKGSKLYIEGRIRTNSWNDKNTGEKRYSTEIFADSVVLLDRAGDDGRRAPEREQLQPSQKIDQIINSANNNDSDIPMEDDLPF
jgi:single-strand DNA-binding protein